MRARLLHIEDDDVVAQSLRRGLYKQHRIPRELHHVYDGVEALAWLRAQGPQHLPDLIVLDLSLPRMNGLQFLAQMREDPDLSASVVFVLTTSAQSRDIEASFAHNVAGYFQKSKMGDDYASFSEVVALLLENGTFPGGAVR